jgi:hypothetical protein
VELRGFEPLTSCMPCLALTSDDVLLVGLPQAGTMWVSECVALGLSLPDGDVTWFVTGFLSPLECRNLHAVQLGRAFSP